MPRTRVLLALTPLLVSACSSKMPASAPVDMARVEMPDAAAAADMAQLTVKLATTSKPILLRQGGTATIPVTVTRGAGTDGAVAVAVEGVPVGVTAQPLTIPAGETTGSLELSASPQASQGGPRALAVTATFGAASSKSGVDLYVAGAPGTVDQSYGSGGIVTLDRPNERIDHCASLALTPKGLPVVAGAYGFSAELALAWRLTDDGLPDPGFGDHGRSVLATPPADSYVWAVAVQPDGKTVLAGLGGPQTAHDDGQVLIARLQTDGSPDSSFGNAGIVEIDFTTGRDAATTVAIQPDGKIVALTNTGNVIRLDSSGTPDPSFGDKGIVALPRNPKATGSDGFETLLLQEDGKIVVGGDTSIDRYEDHGQLLRLTDQGTLDTSFGTDGRTLFSSPKGGTVDITLLASAPDGSIVAVGATTTAQDTGHFVITAFHASRDGAPDLAFGADGYAATIAFTDDLELPGAVAVQRDGKILIASQGGRAITRDKLTAVARLDAHGNLDDTFGVQGKLEVPDLVSSPGGPGPVGMAVDPLGRILIGSSTSVGAVGSSDCMVLRIWP